MINESNDTAIVICHVILADQISSNFLGLQCLKQCLKIVLHIHLSVIITCPNGERCAISSKLKVKVSVAMLLVIS